MKSFIPVNLATEDLLSEVVLRVLLKQTGRPFEVGPCYRKGGLGYLRKIIGGLNHAARGTPFIVLTDLDTEECAAALVSEWLKGDRQPNLVFRVAVRQVEAWLIAHRTGFAEFLGIKETQINRDVESIPDSKRYLLQLATKSRFRRIREDLVPRAAHSATQGPNYNARLSEYVQSRWSAKQAAINAPSLRRALERLTEFTPNWPAPERPEKSSR